MRNLLENMMGKEIEAICEGATIIGKVAKVTGNVLHLEKDGVTCFVNIEKIVLVWDAREKKINPPGFLTGKK